MDLDFVSGERGQYLAILTELAWSIRDLFKWAVILAVECNFCNCVWMPEKFRTSTRFEPVTSRYRCEALTNWFMKPLTLGAGHLWVLTSPWGMSEWWNDIWIHHILNCGCDIKWAMILAVECNFCNCVWKPEKLRTSTRFEPVTLRYRYDTRTNWAMKPLTLGVGHLWVHSNSVMIA